MNFSTKLPMLVLQQNLIQYFFENDNAVYKQCWRINIFSSGNHGAVN